jgi:hypothetical protein
MYIYIVSAVQKKYPCQFHSFRTKNVEVVSDQKAGN